MYENESNNWVDIGNYPQSPYTNDYCESNTSRMIVSDADDDDVSIVGMKFAPSNSYSDMKLGSPSFNNLTTNNTSEAIDEPRQVVTPPFQDSEEFLARTKVDAANMDKNRANNIDSLPFCPPFRCLTDERKTSFTIQPRIQRDKNFSTNLVDEYEVSFLRNESGTKHDFNTRAASKSKDSFSSSGGGIHKNPIDPNLPANLHSRPHYFKFQESVTGISNKRVSKNISDNISNYITSPKPQNQESNQSKLHKRNQKQTHIAHIISKQDENYTSKNTTTMPSKANSCLPRQRSRAIAIKRSRPGDHFIDTTNAFVMHEEKEARRCDAELYDYATWRMYNRIVDHRRKNLLRTQHQDEHHAHEEQQNMHTLQSSITSTSNYVSTSSTIDDRNADRLSRSSSRMRGQPFLVRDPTAYAYDDYLSGSEAEDQIFDLEL